MTPRKEPSPQTRIEREEFARGHIEPGETPVPPRPAATSVVARPLGAAGEFEVLLLERPATARFAAGAFVFPGGVVDPDDGSPFFADRLPHVTEAERPPLVAALRELFEETGLLLSEELPAAGDPAVGTAARDMRAGRADLLAGRTRFADIVRSMDLSFAAARVTYFARWVTPATYTRRYDTRFFFAIAPNPNAEISLTREHVSAAWLTPFVALSRFRTGGLPMLFPTWKTLEGLAELGTLAETIGALERKVVRSVIPRLEMRDGALMPVLPEDDG